MNLRVKNRVRFDFILFLAASAVMGISQSIEGSAYNNFLNDTFEISVLQRTLIEIPRELPGFLVVFITSALMFMGDRRMAVFANAAAGIGMFMLSRFSPSLAMAVFWTFLYSTGQHLFMPLTNSIGMSFSDNNSVGRRLGLIGSVSTAVFLLTSLITYFFSRRFQADYGVLFSIGAGAFFVSALLIGLMSKRANNPADNDQSAAKPSAPKKRFVFRKEYKLFYILSVVYGARKQIFITFGPWVLIKIFEQGVSTFALLGFIIAGTGMLLKPMVGYAIDRFGERFVLICDSVILVIVCLGYGFAEKAAAWMGLSTVWAMYIVCACFIIDQLLTSSSMARATYLRKIAVCEEDVSRTLSLGISIDHAISMVIPFLGAFIWNAVGYSFVFFIGALIAAINALFASQIIKHVRTA